MKVKFKLIALFLVMSMLLTACAPTPTPTAAEDAKPKILTLAQFNPPTGLFVPDLLTTDYDGNIIKQGADFTGTYLYRLYMANGVNCKLILYRSFSKC